ncbi:MAG: hypothetical protein Q7U97_15315 [Rhodocyclaceae bacterium]|nr:hypothetical protein [Rhodocyclaceae bacterium]
MSPVKVISQQPPGGRCTLYARYADAIAEVVGWTHRIVHDECRDAHGEGYPSLWIHDAAIQPADGVILSPDDICDYLGQHGVEPDRIDVLHPRLTTTLDDFLEHWAP